MLDRRLLPLIETLTRSDLDWLALEVINGALAGRAPNEPSEAIIAARSVAFRQKQDAGVQEFTSATEQPGQPFSWQEQIEWAVKHVLERISQGNFHDVGICGKAGRDRRRRSRCD